MNPDQLQAYRTYSQRVAKNKRNRNKRNPIIKKMEEDIMRAKIRSMIEKNYPNIR